MAINPTDAVAAYNSAARSAGVRGVDSAPQQGQGSFQSVLQGVNAQQDPQGTQLAAGAGMQTPNAQAVDANGQPIPNTFSQLMRNTVQQAVMTSKEGEAAAMQAITGQADLRDVVMAVSNAELTLQTVVAVRDKVVGAYNEIIKMPI